MVRNDIVEAGTLEHVGFWSRMVLKFKKSADTDIRDGVSDAGCSAEDDQAIEKSNSTIATQPGNSSLALQVDQASQPSGERAFQLGSRQAAVPSKNRGPREQDARSATSRETLLFENAKLSKTLERMNAAIENQTQRAGEILCSLDRVNGTLADNAKVVQAQTGLLSSIRDAATDEAQNRKHLAEELVQLPKIADIQRETMVSISRQLELVRETSARVADVLNEFQTSSSSLAAEIKESTRTAGHLVSDMKQREERWEGLVREEVNRLKPIIWSGLALLGVMVLTGIIGLFR